MRPVKLLTTACLVMALATSAQAQVNWWEPEPDFPYDPFIPPVPPAPPAPTPIPVPGPTPTVPDAGATIIKIGLAPRTPNGSVSGIDTTTTDIDQFLSTFGDPYIDFGSNYTRDLANAGFEELRQAKADLNADVRRDLLADDVFDSISYLNFDIQPATLKLSQTNLNLSADIGTLSAGIRAKTGVSFCGTAKIGGYLSGIGATSTYNLYTGRLMDTDVRYSVDDIDVSCSNPIAQIVLAIIDIFVDKEAEVDKAIRKALSKSIMKLEAKDYFGIEDILDGVEPYVDSLAGVPLVGGQAAAEAQTAIDAARATLGDPNVRGSGVVLNLTLSDAATNEISFIASHDRPQITHLEYGPGGVMISLNPGDNTERIDIYAQYPYGQTWTKVTTVYGSHGYIARQLDRGTKLVAIGRNRTFGDLYSLPSNQRTTTWDYLCRGANCPNFY